MKKILYICRSPHLGNELNYYKDIAECNSSTLASLYHKFKDKDMHIEIQLDLNLLPDEKLNDIDIIVTHLPFMNIDDAYEKGLNKLREIREKYPNIPVIVYSGADPEIVSDEELKALGVREVIRKENFLTDIKKLKESLERILDQN